MPATETDGIIKLKQRRNVLGVFSLAEQKENPLYLRRGENGAGSTAGLSKNENPTSQGATVSTHLLPGVASCDQALSPGERAWVASLPSDRRRVRQLEPTHLGTLG